MMGTRGLHLMVLAACFSLWTSSACFSQTHEPEKSIRQKQKELLSLENLQTVKEFPLPAEYKLLNTLPAVVDNSIYPYMPPVFWQNGYCCSQAAGIGYAFTYEINRLRNVSATNENRYPTHFIYNFQNMGNETAPNIAEAWDLMKTCGTPNVDDYGGMHVNPGPQAIPSDRVWISSFNVYESALSNQVKDFFMIKAGNPEGILKLKHWIADHLAGETTGGLGCLYVGLDNLVHLPAGTPEAGKTVFYSVLSNPDHCLTLVGYNDSIRYDVNQDGQYTNDIDITGDGMVDLSDWEIGGFKFVNSFDETWADNGYSYLLYRTFGFHGQDGGIYNQAAFVVRAKASYQPLLTYKVVLQHNKRNSIRLLLGVSPDTSDLQPACEMEYPIFNHQGGKFDLQGLTGGKTNEQQLLTDTDTLEFALDATSLLSYVSSGLPARFFFIVEETDIENTANGSIRQFSVVDSSNGSVITFPQSDIPIQHSGRTTLYVDHTCYFNDLQIIEDHFPNAQQGTPYSYQLSAYWGDPPYSFKQCFPYMESDPAPGPFPWVYNTPLPSDSSLIVLPFDFPFYGETFDSIYVHQHGYVHFTDYTYPWTFIIDEHILFKNVPNISVFQSKSQWNSDASIYYSLDTNQVTIRWLNKFFSPSTPSELNYAVKLEKNGNITFYYDSLNYPWYLTWLSGVSKGDDLNFLYSSLSNNHFIPRGTRVLITPESQPLGMSLSTDGVFHGVPDTGYCSYQIHVQCEDDQKIRTWKTLPFLVFGTSGLGTVTEEGFSCSPEPNPFHQETEFKIHLPGPGKVSLSVFNTLGVELYRQINNTYLTGGDHILRFNQPLYSLAGLPPGIYLYRLSYNGMCRTGKLIKQ